MKNLKQIRILTKKSHQNYLKDFIEEPLNFQEYLNLELGRLFDNKYNILSIDFLRKKTVTIIYEVKI